MSAKTHKPSIPGEVRRYLSGCVPSVPYLEAALLLRAQPGEEWSAAKLAKRLYVRQRDASDLLLALQAADVAVGVAGSAEFRYTEDPSLRMLLDAVAQAYAANLFEVTELIHAKTDKRARVFAEAFKLRKD